MKNKNAISLIVLVITILVMAILATTVIITLSNTNIITKSRETVDEYNMKQLKESIETRRLELYAKNGGKDVDIFTFINYLKNESVITDEQRQELLHNSGRIGTGKNALQLGTGSIIKYEGATVSETDDKYRISFEYELDILDNIEYTSFGALFLPDFVITSEYSDIPLEEIITIQDSYNLDINDLTAKNYVKKDGKYRFNVSLSSIPSSNSGTTLYCRPYVKCVIDGEEIVMHMPINSAVIELGN